MPERVTFPQRGGCICGDVRYGLKEDPVTFYVCHCTDCQALSGSSFSLSLVVRAEALEEERGETLEQGVQLPDGRTKAGTHCARCFTPLWGRSRVAGLMGLNPGTLDDPTWLRPAGHIWTRSALPWTEIPAGALRFDQGAEGEQMLDLVRAWKAR